eukprot:TRINITY_DN25364_c0_g1_i2.p1 TRINITY_DN25364_c0_g1~~TRINITY_DN25364_c0_g1_i2.p1  ORF type:complete len:584 (-),score=63.29 TRINITY_DN25364_c0_g1_i2:289-2040(-)
MIPPSKDSGHLFGRPDDQFRIDEKIGGGAQAKVFSCTRLNTGKPYAAKKVQIGFENYNRAGKVRVDLNREIQIMQRLTHPSIVNLLAAFWESADVCFIVMDLARGGSLHGKLEGGKGLGGPEDTIEIASRHVSWQILQGLGYMHDKAVVHRDLKPENVLIRDSEAKVHNGSKYFLHEVKIADFGLSRTLLHKTKKENMTQCGTPQFAAPEVVIGRYDEHADFWSFGCMIFAMLCGSYPFEHLADLENPEPINECDRWHKVSENARSIVKQLLIYDPDERLGLDGCLRHGWFLTLPTKELHHRASVLQRQNSVAGASGVFKKVSGWVGEAVDRLEVEFWRSETPRLLIGAPTGGEHQREWTLKEEEMVIAVRQEIYDGYLGKALVLFTSHCRVMDLRGSDSVQRRSFVAPIGCQIVGLQFLDGTLQGIHLENAPRKCEDARVERIEGHMGYAVDRLKFTLRDGSTREYGPDEGGDLTSETALEKDEYIIIVEQGPRDGYLGYSIAFYTSKMRAIVLRGMDMDTSTRFIAPKGKQICGFEFEGHRLANVKLCPTSGPTSGDQESLESCDGYDGSPRQRTDMCVVT